MMNLGHLLHLCCFVHAYGRFTPIDLPLRNSQQVSVSLLPLPLPLPVFPLYPLSLSRAGGEIAGEGDCERPSASDSAMARSALQSSKPGTSRSVYSSLSWNLCGKQVGSGGGNRLSSSAETSRDCVWLVRHVAWLMTRYNTGRDRCSPSRRIFGKPYEGSLCKFGEQVHYKLSGRSSSRTSMGARCLDW